MIVKGTKLQILQMAANAVNAAVPVGMGFLQATSKKFTPSDFKLDDDDLVLSLDYVVGRMTKLYISSVGHERWKLPDSKPSPDYQSWCRTYPSYTALAESAGLEVVAE